MASIADIRQKFPQYADMSDQQLADAVYQKFYSDMPRDQFDAKMGGQQAQGAAPALLHDKYRDAAPAPADQPTPNNPLASPLPGPLGQAANTFNAASAGGENASLLNMGQEIYAGGMAIPKAILDATQGKGFDIPRAFGDELALSEQTEAAKRGLNPGAYDAGGNLGALATMGKAPPGGGALVKGLLAPGNKGLVKRAALQSGAVGFTSGFGQPGSIQDRLINGAEGGATAAAVGAGVGKIATMLDGTPATPKVQQLFDNARKFFKSAEKSQAVTDKVVGQQFATDLRTFLAARGKVTPSGQIAAYPEVAHAVKLADDFAQRPMTIAQWQTLRENIADAAGSKIPKERELGKKMIDMLDKHVTGLPAGAFIHGNGQQAIVDWTNGRALWHVAEKGKSVEDLIAAAKRQSRKSAATPVEQATRNKFDLFASKEKNLRGFSPEERAAIMRVGNGTTIGNVAKGVGRLAPTTLASLSYKAGGPAFLGTLLGGPVVGGVAATGSIGLGVVGKIISNLSTKNQAELARLLVLNGGKVPKAIPTQASTAVKKALGNLMLVGYGASKAPAVTGAVTNWLSSLNGGQEATQ